MDVRNRQKYLNSAFNCFNIPVFLQYVLVHSLFCFTYFLHICQLLIFVIMHNQTSFCPVCIAVPWIMTMYIVCTWEKVNKKSASYLGICWLFCPMMSRVLELTFRTFFKFSKKMNHHYNNVQQIRTSIQSN